MSRPTSELDALIDRERLADLVMDLVRIRSHPGEEADCAKAYAKILRDIGMDVELDEQHKGSPSVIGRLHGGPGPTLQLAGHLDTVPVDHPEPEIKDGVIYGRGSCDMKAGLAAFAEVARIMNSSVKSFSGNLLITCYGQHEGSRTNSMHEPLRDLLRRGVKGDSALVGDCCHGEVPLKGKGSLIYELEFSRPGRPEHEIFGRPNVPSPLMAGYQFIREMRERSGSWTAYDPDLGGETFFVGAFHSGDMYNTVPTSASLQGTRRYPFPRTFEEAKVELETVASAIAAGAGLEARLVCHRSGQPFSVDEKSEIVNSLQRAARAVDGTPLPINVSQFATDLNHIIEVARIPAVLYGVDGGSAHSLPEFVRIDDLFRVTRLYLGTTADYLKV